MQRTLNLQHRDKSEAETDGWVCCSKQLNSEVMETFRASLLHSPFLFYPSVHFLHLNNCNMVHNVGTDFCIQPSRFEKRERLAPHKSQLWVLVSLSQCSSQTLPFTFSMDVKNEGKNCCDA